MSFYLSLHWVGLLCTQSKDHEKALHYFSKSANQGNALAQLHLGMVFFKWGIYDPLGRVIDEELTRSSIL